MKFIHLSDLHIGKRVNEYSMLEDQGYILTEIINIIDEINPDGVIIAGDVYDKSVPSAEAVTLFDNFLVRLSKRKLSVFIISGNHDSPERLSFGAKLMEGNNIFISPVYEGKIDPVILEDEYGKIYIWMLPFIKPVNVRRFYEDEQINSYTDAVRVVVDNMNINTKERNILITHQFVTGAERTESEEISVGGSDNVDVSVFQSFDYTALGHIHRPQNCKMENVRYSGTPLKYSFSESKDNKSLTVVELCEKGNMKISTYPLVPLRDMVEIKGRYDDIVSRDFYKDTNYQNDYVHITLTDEDDIIDAVGKLRSIYHNLLKIDYDNLRTRNANSIDSVPAVENISPYEHFCEFYEKVNSQTLNEKQENYIKGLIEEIWEGNI